MPQTVNFKLNTKFVEGGPTIPDVTRENKVSACISIIEEVAADKNWAVFDILAGSADQVEFMLFAADRYKDQNCPRDDEPGILFQFKDKEENFYHLDGPLLYAGHTAACLPRQVDKVWIQNRMTEKVKIYLLVGRKMKKKEPLASTLKANLPASSPDQATGSNNP